MSARQHLGPVAWHVDDEGDLVYTIDGREVAIISSDWDGDWRVATTPGPSSGYEGSEEECRREVEADIANPSRPAPADLDRPSREMDLYIGLATAAVKQYCGGRS